MIISTTGIYKQNMITVPELFAVVKAASKVPTCVQYKGTLVGESGCVYCELHFYKQSTLGCKTWTEESGPIAYTMRKFRGWRAVSDFITGLVPAHVPVDFKEQGDYEDA